MLYMTRNRYGDRAVFLAAMLILKCSIGIHSPMQYGNFDSGCKLLVAAKYIQLSG